MNKDKLFSHIKDPPEPFTFNRDVAEVFDDMLVRSVPFYRESIRRQAQLCTAHYRENTRVYDLGCSNGNLGLLILDRFRGESPFMIAVDSSRPMVEKYARRLKDHPGGKGAILICGLLENVRIRNASVVLMNLTLQFIAPSGRDALMHHIFQGLNPGGILILTEKVRHPEKRMNDLQIRFYEQFKLENGYSEMEISRKREALENVLVPDTLDAHEKRLKQAGFKTVDTWLKWFNFASLLAVKH